MMKEPNVTVCILQDTNIHFRLNGSFKAKGNSVSGFQCAECVDGCIKWNGKLYQELLFQPEHDAISFDIVDVRIGINFHWERKENQTFKGALKMIVNDGRICAINLIHVEDYLLSVISSEMNASAPIEFLKSHAVISRSWLLAQMDKRRKLNKSKKENSFFSFVKTDHSLVRWYDRQDHTLFDVCADDHCQRYQGVNKASNSQVKQVIEDTRGQVLSYNGAICDARFSKCCGGMMERYSACWEDLDYPYLMPVRDCNDNDDLSDLDIEENAVRWIQSQPKAFCNTTDKRILSMVLNSYDQETTHFYRWNVEYTQQQISELINRKTKINFGNIIDIIPVRRGKSARIIMMRVVGTKQTFSFGKELEIRRILSETHLLSSAFFVEKLFNDKNTNNIPDKFILHGAGWGHGVGLCQIGAAVMGEQGYNYRQILQHYYPNSNILKMYE